MNDNSIGNLPTNGVQLAAFRRNLPQIEPRSVVINAIGSLQTMRYSALILAVIMATSAGCVRRRMTVRTNPAGAMVYIDKQPIGVSPVSHSFIYYGTREITIVKDGYRTEKFLRTFNPPWYQIPPLDFVSETLWPLEQRDERIIDVELIPEPVVATDALIASGNELRLQSANGIAVTPPGVSRRSPDPTIPLGRSPAPLYPEVGQSILDNALQRNQQNPPVLPPGPNPLGPNPLGPNPLGPNPLGPNPLGSGTFNAPNPPVQFPVTPQPGFTTPNF